MRNVLLTLCGLVAPVCLAFAQPRTGTASSGVQDSLQAGQTPKYELEPVVVTATRQPRPILRVPYAVDLVDQEAIQRAEAGLSLDETLRALPGLIVNNRYNLSQGDRVSLRGVGSRASFGVRGLKFIQDGIPLTFADGQSQLTNIDLGSAGQIEVLRGPSSSLYGNAAGGFVNLQTQAAADAPFQLQPRLIAGSHGLWKWQGKATGRIGRSEYVVNVHTLWQDGFRDFSNARSTNLNAVGRHGLSDRFDLTTVFNYYDAPYLLNPSSLDKATAKSAPASARMFVKRQGASKEITQGQGGVTLHYRDEADNRLDVTVYGVGRSLFNPIPGQIIDLDRAAGGVRTVYSRQTRAGNTSLQWTAGVDFEFQDDARKEFENDGIPADQVGRVHDDRIFDILQVGPKVLDQNEQVLGGGPFVEFDFSPRPNWNITIGGRYDRFRFKVDDHFLADNVDDSGSRTMDQISPMAGLTYRPHRTVTLYGNFATGFQTPTTTELSNRSTGEGGFNPDLDPERLRSFEAGVKGMWPNGRLTWETAFYVLHINDMLLPFQIDDPNTEEIFFRNAGKTRNVGMDIKLSWKPVSGLQTSLAYTLMDFEFRDFQVETTVNNAPTPVQLKGRNVPGVPPQHLFAGAGYTHPRGLYSEVNVQWFDEYFANDFNGPPPGSIKPVGDFINDAYTLVDLRAGFRRNVAPVGLDVFFGVNNLFDTRYNGSIVPNAVGDRFFEPGAGRTWYLGVEIPVPAIR